MVGSLPLLIAKDPQFPPLFVSARSDCWPICSIFDKPFSPDVVQKLWELEFTIHKVKVSTRPDNKAINLFFVTDNQDTRDNRYCSSSSIHTRGSIAPEEGLCPPPSHSGVSEVPYFLLMGVVMFTTGISCH
jgi:hypothetical protein